jgi:hypothetical protein
MKVLTQKDVLSMTKKARKYWLDYYQDLCCNTDYIKDEVLYGVYAKNVEILTQKIEYNEY